MINVRIEGFCVCITQVYETGKEKKGSIRKIFAQRW